MKIDVSERIETTVRLTQEWAERAGYKQPEPEPENLSKKANDLRRILAVSDFGCQARNVQAILECLIGESIPASDRNKPAEYLRKEPFVIGSCLVPLRWEQRPALVARISGSGNAGLRMSNGELHNNHMQQADLRPATREEIETYFSEFFGVTIHPADTGNVPGEPVADLEVPF